MFIDIFDYLLWPFYVGILYFFTKRMAAKEEAELQKPMMNAFWLRVAGSFIYSMVVQYYYGYGDSVGYFHGSGFFRNMIAKDLGNISYLFAPFGEMQELYEANAPDPEYSGYFSAPASNMVIRIAAITSYVTFYKFLTMSLFFGYFSFLGQWKLFKVLDHFNKFRERKLLAIAVLYSPSIWFWGSGLLKDSLCLGSLGFIIYILYTFFVKKKFSLIKLGFLVGFILVVFVIKSYIISISVLGFAAFLLAVFLKSIKNKVLRGFFLVIALTVMSIFLYAGDFMDQVNKLTEESVAQFQEFQKQYAASADLEVSSRAGFGVGELYPSLGSLIVKSPLVIFTCLFRPFIWESRKVFILFTSLETFMVFLATFYLMFKIGLFKFFGTIFKFPYLVYCFTVSMLFALIIGFTTFNFGTMIRYKVIFLPFYYFMLVNLYTLYKEKKALKQAALVAAVPT